MSTDLGRSLDFFVLDSPTLIPPIYFKIHILPLLKRVRRIYGGKVKGEKEDFEESGPKLGTPTPYYDRGMVLTRVLGLD